MLLVASIRSLFLRSENRGAPGCTVPLVPSRHKVASPLHHLCSLRPGSSESWVLAAGVALALPETALGCPQSSLAPPTPWPFFGGCGLRGLWLQPGTECPFSDGPHPEALTLHPESRLGMVPLASESPYTPIPDPSLPGSFQGLGNLGVHSEDLRACAQGPLQSSREAWGSW